MFYGLQAVGVEARSAGPLGLIAMAASPVLLSRVIADTRAAGAVTDRALTLSTLSTLYALVLSAAKAQIFANPQESLWHDITPVLQVLLVSGRGGGRVVCPDSCRAALDEPLEPKHRHRAAGADCGHGGQRQWPGRLGPLGGAAGGHGAEVFRPQPLPWTQALGSISALLGMVVFVLVAAVAAHAPWTGGIPLAVLALVGLRLVAKTVGIGLGTGAATPIGGKRCGRPAPWLLYLQ